VHCIKIILLSFLLVTSINAKHITVSYDPDYAPFSYNIKGKAYGLFIDIWKLLAKKNHHTLTFVKAKDWDNALELAQNKEVDFFLGTTPYESWMKKSIPYYQTQTSLYTLNSFKKSIKHIGIIGNDYKIPLKTKFPQSTIYSYNDYETLFKALLNKKVDAIYDDSIALSYFAITHQYTPFIQKSSLFIESSKIDAISTDTKNITLFNEGFKALSTSELKEIEQKWISNKSERYFGNLNSFMKHKITYVYDPDWRPFEWNDEMRNIHVGIISDLIHLISQKTGITFQAIHTKNWEDSVTLMREGKADMFSAVPYTEERAKYLQFTKHNIYSYPAVLVSHKEKPLGLDENFDSKTIGIVKGNSLGTWIKTQYPHAHFKTLKNVKYGFKAIEDKEIDFFAINGITALYYINILGFNQTKIYTKMSYMFHLKLALQKHIAPEVFLSIDNALSDISQSDLNTIYRKWTSIKIQKELNWKLLFIILSIVLTIIFIFIFLNKKLKKIVKEKTLELRELNRSLEYKVAERTEELAKTNQHIQDSITYASLIQRSILPQDNDLAECFKHYFVIWKPKDIVGGDIYFFTKLNEDEYFLVIIDCTGHGVSGAFVTMLMKAIQEQLNQELQHHTYTPDLILQYINQSFKNLLKQEYGHSNVGADAGVVYINKKENYLQYAGANISLFYTEGNTIHLLKGERKSLGYKQSNLHDTYKTFTLPLQNGMQFYLTTDGYIDQNGGEKGFSFGRKRLLKTLHTLVDKSFDKQKETLLSILSTYQGKEEQNDDITIIGFQI